MPAKKQVSSLFQTVGSDTAIGLDIGTYSIKVAQIRKKRFSHKSFLSFGIKEISEPRSHSSIVSAIKAVCNETRIDSNKVKLSIYGPEIIMRYITLPALESFDLSHCLDFELERYIPGKQRSNMIIDYKILYRLPNNQMVVLLIALDKEIMQERVSLVREAGLDPQSVNVDSLALMEAYKAQGASGKGDEIAAILDIGYSVSKLVVFQADTPYFSRDISTSGVASFLQLVSGHLNLEPAKAREFIFEPGERAKEVFEALRLNLESLRDELRLSFEYCGRNLQKKVSRLYLSGGGSKIKMLAESLSASLNLSALLLDVTGAFVVSSSLSQEKIKELSPLIPVAVGLAMG